MVDHPHYRYATGTRPDSAFTREYLKDVYGVDWDKIDGVRKPDSEPVKNPDHVERFRRLGRG